MRQASGLDQEEQYMVCQKKGIYPESNKELKHELYF